MSRRAYITAMVIWRYIFPKDQKSELGPQIVKKYQNTVTQDMEEKGISMYGKAKYPARMLQELKNSTDDQTQIIDILQHCVRKMLLLKANVIISDHVKVQDTDLH